MNTKKITTLAVAALLVSLMIPLYLNNAHADGDQYILTLNLSGVGGGVVFVNGTGTLDPAQYTCSLGDTYQLNAIAAFGWNFSGWNGDLTSSDNPLTVTMDTNTTVTAQFIQNSYTVEVDQSFNGTINPSTASYSSGSNQDFTITPDNGYCIESITVDNQAVDVTSQFSQTVSLENIQADHTITATYAPATYNLTADTIGQGIVTPNQGSYSYGDSVLLWAEPSQGWTFQSWSDGSTNTAITIVMNDNENVTATFVQNPTPSPTPMLTATPSPSPTSSPSPAPTSSPSPAPTSSPTPTPLAPTLAPKLNTAGISEYVIVAASGLIVAGIVLGLFWQRRKK